MTVSTAGDVDITVQVSTGGSHSVRGRTVPNHVVSVLFGTDLETWRRGWDGPGSAAPRREAVFLASDRSRSAVAEASTGVIPNQGVVYTVLGPNPEPDRVLGSVSEALSEADNETTSVLIDDIEPLATRSGAAVAGKTVVAIATAAVSAGGSITIGCTLTPESAQALVPIADIADRIVGVDPEAMAAIDTLQQTDPTTFGYTRRHWAEAQRGIESCTRNYPQSKQVHAAISAPKTTPRTLGAALSGLVSLDVLDVWGDTVGPTRYDLTAYDRSRMAAVGSAFVARESGNSNAD